MNYLFDLFFAQSSLIKSEDLLLSTCKECSGTLSLTTLPAATTAPLPILTGATNTLFEPMDAFSPINVFDFFIPSKLAVIVPAPILLSLPILESPIYAK